MTDPTALRHALADSLLDLTRDQLIATTPGFKTEPPSSQAANVAVNAMRQLIGESVARFAPGPERQAMKAQMAGLLGSLLGQLMTGMDPRQAILALEAHGSHMAMAMEPQVRVTGQHPFSTRPASAAPHLKVV